LIAVHLRQTDLTDEVKVSKQAAGQGVILEVFSSLNDSMILGKSLQPIKASGHHIAQNEHVAVSSYAKIQSGQCV